MEGIIALQDDECIFTFQAQPLSYRCTKGAGFGSCYCSCLLADVNPTHPPPQMLLVVIKSQRIKYSYCFCESNFYLSLTDDTFTQSGS